MRFNISPKNWSDKVYNLCWCMVCQTNHVITKISAKSKIVVKKISKTPKAPSILFFMIKNRFG